MLAIGDTGSRALWEVIWVHPKEKRLVRKDYGTDLQSAVDLYTKLKGANRRGVTLRCKNMGFPPPDELADREIITTVIKGRRVRAKRVMQPRQYLKRMGVLNARGIWWCPYCRQQRRFIKTRGFYVRAVWVAEERMVCPVCRVSDHDWHVRRYNPIATNLEMRRGRISDPNRKSRRRRERQRRREQS